MKMTIYDVAEKAGVSISTVSRVINNTGRISVKTRRMVLRVMEEMDYHPNVHASALTGKKTNMIGLITPDISNRFEMSGVIRPIIFVFLPVKADA